MAANSQLFIAVTGGNYYLVSTRGLMHLKHPDTINNLKAAGVPAVGYDQGSFDELKRVHSDAP